MTRVAAIQMASGPNIDANINEASCTMKAAKNAGAELVVLPENFALMGLHESDHVKNAETPGAGKIQDFLAEQAEKLKIWIVGGTVPVVAGNDKTIVVDTGPDFRQHQCPVLCARDSHCDRTRRDRGRET